MECDRRFATKNSKLIFCTFTIFSKIPFPKYLHKSMGKSRNWMKQAVGTRKFSFLAYIYSSFATKMTGNFFYGDWKFYQSKRK